MNHAGKLFISKVAKDCSNNGLTETENHSFINLEVFP